MTFFFQAGGCFPGQPLALPAKPSPKLNWNIVIKHSPLNKSIVYYICNSNLTKAKEKL
jgi:hypothetical protein